MAKGSGKTTFIVFIMFMMCLSSIVAAGGLYVTSKEKVEGSNLEIRSEASNIAVLPRPGNIVGRYNATSLKGTKWNDLSGKGNHITSEKIKGTLSKAEGFKGEYVKGTKDDGFTLPQKFENNHWSFFAVARYGSDQNQQRIFVSGDTEKIKVGDDDEHTRNWLIGHHDKKTGVAYYNDWVTSKDKSVHGIRPWIRITAQHNYFATNGKSRSTDFSFDKKEQKPNNNPKSIGINVGEYMDTQSSDWNVYEILVYDTYLDTVDREKVDTYLKEKYILTDLKSGISLTGGRPKIDGDIKLSTDDGKSEPWYGGEPRFGTQEDCRRFAQELGYPQWGHYNEKYSDKSKVNTCFFYGDTVVEIKDTDKTVDGTVDGKTREDMTFGCTKTYRTPEMNCEAGSGTGGPNTIGGVAATASGAYCQAKKELNPSVGKDWVQANVCSKHCTKDACMEPGATFTYSTSGASNTLTDFCEWNNTPHIQNFYDELIKDVATHSKPEIPNKDEDGNIIDYLGKHLAKCKDFKAQAVVEGVRYVWFGWDSGDKDTWLTIAEIEVYSGGVNIVKDWDKDTEKMKGVEVSSTHAHGGGILKKDLLFDGHTHTDDNYFHSKKSKRNFIRIDLGKEYMIQKVIVFNRKTCNGCNNRWETARLKLYASDGTTVLKEGETVNSDDTTAGSKTYLF